MCDKNRLMIDIFFLFALRAVIKKFLLTVALNDLCFSDGRALMVAREFGVNES